jgi:hypothetical protein
MSRVTWRERTIERHACANLPRRAARRRVAALPSSESPPQGLAALYSSIKYSDKGRDKAPGRYSPTLTSHSRDQLAISWRRTRPLRNNESKAGYRAALAERSRNARAAYGVPYRIAARKYVETLRAAARRGTYGKKTQREIASPLFLSRGNTSNQ